MKIKLKTRKSCRIEPKIKFIFHPSRCIFYSSPASKPQTPLSRIPVRTANAEKRARDLGLVQDIDESNLSPSELRAFR